MWNHIDDEPLLPKTEILAVDAERLAHHRVRSVGADHITGPHAADLVRRHLDPGLGLIDTPEQERGSVPILLEPLRGPAALDGHPAVRTRASVKRRLEGRLEEQPVGRPA